MLRTRREQFIKWTTEGAVKAGFVLVSISNVSMRQVQEI